MKKSRVIQLSPTLSFGDAVSNDVFAMNEVLTKLGYENYIVAMNISKKVAGRAVPFKKFVPRKTDIFIYHMSIGNELSDYVISADVSRKLMVYHNITPAHFFDGISHLNVPCRKGRDELRRLSECIDFALCDSDFNKEELDDLKYRETATLPIVFDKTEYASVKPSEEILELYDNDDYTNILFVGRIAPNKKQEDILQSFHLYNKYINPKSRLFLVGAVVTTELYMNALKDYVFENKIENVFFSGHVSFPEILAYYKAADIFLCESEHEGFCVPLLEAMTFDLPVIAYASTAIPYTMGDSGILFTEKDPKLVAELLNLVATDENLRQKIIEKQRERLDYFDINRTKDRFAELITPWLSEGSDRP